MEAVGFAASIIGVAGAALTSSRALYDIVDDVRNAPEELSAISKDTHSFHDIVDSIQMALKDPIINRVLQEDQQLYDWVKKLEEPMKNCSTIMEQLKPRVESYLRVSSNGTVRVSRTKISWIFKKKDFIECRNRLEATKSTLNSALGSIVFLCNLRFAGQNANLSHMEAAESLPDIDIRSILREYAESIAPDTPPLEAVTIETTESIAAEPPSLEVLSIENAKLNALPLPLLEDAAERSESSNIRHSITDLKLCVFSGDVEAVKRMITEGYNVNQLSEGNNTALHYAVTAKRSEIVRMLIAAGANPNVRRREDDWTLLHHAVSHVYILKLLLQSGADIAARDNNGWTTLGIAILRALAESVKLLIKWETSLTGNVNNYDMPLHIACRQSCLEVVKALLEQGKQLNQLRAMLEQTNHWGRTPISLAVEENWMEAVGMLLEYGANIHLRNGCRETPLITAASDGNLEMVEYLISKGADRHAKDKLGGDYLYYLRELHPKKYEDRVRKLGSEA